MFLFLSSWHRKYLICREKSLNGICAMPNHSFCMVSIWCQNLPHHSWHEPLNSSLMYSIKISVHEDDACRIVKLVRALRKGWIKRDRDVPKEPEAYLLWGEGGNAMESTATGESCCVGLGSSSSPDPSAVLLLNMSLRLPVRLLSHIESLYDSVQCPQDCVTLLRGSGLIGDSMNKISWK